MPSHLVPLSPLLPFLPSTRLLSQVLVAGQEGSLVGIHLFSQVMLPQIVGQGLVESKCASLAHCHYSHPPSHHHSIAKLLP
jgi:hypothetical protein